VITMHPCLLQSLTPNSESLRLPRNAPVQVLLLFLAAGFFVRLPLVASGLPPYQPTSMKPRTLPVSGLPKGGVTLAGALSPDGTRMALLLWQKDIPSGPASSGTLQIEVWDTATLKPLATRTLGNQLPAWANGRTVSYLRQLPFGLFVTYGTGGTVIVPTTQKVGFYILRGDTLDTLHLITLGPDTPYYGPDLAEISPDGKRVAVSMAHFEDPAHGYLNFLQGCEVRVYNVETGGLLWGTSFDDVGVKDVAWSPDGERLAVALLTGDPSFVRPRKIQNVRVLDSLSGREVLAFEAGPGGNSLCLGGHGEILTLPIFPVRHGPLKHEKGKVWDGQTGRLLREIGYPGLDVQGELETSTDGRVLLGYVMKGDIGFSWRAMEDDVRGWKGRLAVWDARDGNLLGSTPDIYIHARVHASDGSIIMRLTDCARTALSADGSRALLYWPCVSGQYPSPMLFDLPQVPLVERK
jgi:WD40 repeat protein